MLLRSILFLHILSFLQNHSSLMTFRNAISTSLIDTEFSLLRFRNDYYWNFQKILMVFEKSENSWSFARKIVGKTLEKS